MCTNFTWSLKCIYYTYPTHTGILSIFSGLLCWALGVQRGGNGNRTKQQSSRQELEPPEHTSLTSSRALLWGLKQQPAENWNPCFQPTCCNRTERQSRESTKVRHEDFSNGKAYCINSQNCMKAIYGQSGLRKMKQKVKLKSSGFSLAWTSPRKEVDFEEPRPLPFPGPLEAQGWAGPEVASHQPLPCRSQLSISGVTSGCPSVF